MLKRLSELVARLRGQQAKNVAAYDLSAEQLQALNVLRTYDEWQTFLTLIDSVSVYRAESMLYENDPIKGAFMRGYIAALRELPLTAERLALQHANARDRSADQPTDKRRAAKRASLYATPNWPSQP